MRYFKLTADNCAGVSDNCISDDVITAHVCVGGEGADPVDPARLFSPCGTKAGEAWQDTADVEAAVAAVYTSRMSEHTSNDSLLSTPQPQSITDRTFCSTE